MFKPNCMVRGPLVLVTAPKPQAKGPLHPGVPAAWNGVPKGVENPPGAWKIWRLKALKKDARKSTVAPSAILVFLPMVKSSFFDAKVRAVASDRPSLPKVKYAGSAKA